MATPYSPASPSENAPAFSEEVVHLTEKPWNELTVLSEHPQPRCVYYDAQTDSHIPTGALPTSVDPRDTTTHQSITAFQQILK